MKLLLDTHAFLWWLSDPQRTEPATREAIGDFQNQVLVSVVVLWEIAIKRSIGKLAAPLDLERVVPEAGFELLQLRVRHISETERLPLHHRDPFDRLLIAQAIVEGATIVTRDSAISRYSPAVLSA